MDHSPNDIVGHKTFDDGHGGFRHEPLTRAESDAIFARIKERDAEWAARMPDDKAALRAMMDAFYRLKQLGWRDAIYCPKDGSEFEVIEPGSSGIHRCVYQGEWPKGSWWILSDGDMHPSRPILFRLPVQQPAAMATGEDNEHADGR